MQPINDTIWQKCRQSIQIPTIFDYIIDLCISQRNRSLEVFEPMYSMNLGPLSYRILMSFTTYARGLIRFREILFKNGE